MKNSTTYILLGSNLGERERSLAKAREMISLIDGMLITAESSIYESDAIDMGENQPSFLNQVIRATFSYSPARLLDELERIEREMGRESKGKLMPRTIDLDILFFGQQIMTTTRLTIPHKQVLKRDFAIVPLLEIEPDFVVPDTNIRLDQHQSTMSRTTLKRYKEHATRSF